MAAALNSQYPWYPGQNAQGADVSPNGMIAGGVIQKQAGVRSFPPAITAPGTAASGGTVSNSTGVDCLAYLSASGGITSVKILSYNGGNSTAYSPPGTVPPGDTAGPYLVPSPGAVAPSYSGTLSWTWQPA